jgi:hypothetical protein
MGQWVAREKWRLGMGRIASNKMNVQMPSSFGNYIMNHQPFLGDWQLEETYNLELKPYMSSTL